ncbi:MAG: hypothetical protein ACW96X_05645 [Promethearchaeota archaeon]|jgi:hypothetical protein
MINDIIHIDWFFVDTIIIALLILLLLSVKIFKSTYRWRLSFSNEALEYHSFHNIEEQVRSRNLSTKYWDLTRNTSLINTSVRDKVILILRTKYKKKLLRILTEGLSTYGFTVISVKVKKKNDSNSQISEKIINEVFALISSIITISKQKGFIQDSDYTLLEYSNSLLANKAILTEPNNKGLILLNPKLATNHTGIQEKILNNQQQYPQLFYIFSKRSIFILKNRNLKRYKKILGDENDNKIKLVILEKSHRNFKYYETILLGIIIDIIENKIIESKDRT